jgi:hypothetical protein
MCAQISIEEIEMASPVLAFAQLANECEKEGLSAKNAERIAGEIAKIFNVHADEVGILKMDQQHLTFTSPRQLGQVGSIPLNTSGSVAARTANTKRAEVINNFAQAKHVSVFESVELGGKSKSIGAQHEADKQAHMIQKMMSAPVVGADAVLGVVQVCRKGPTGPTAGPDFSPAELQKLVAICAALAKCFK